MIEICVTYPDGTIGAPHCFAIDIISVGRSPQNDIVLPDDRVSALHGRIVLRDGRYYYQDLNSTNGSLLVRYDDKIKVHPSAAEGVELEAGDMLLLGDARTPVTLLIASFTKTEKEKPKQKRRSEPTILAHYPLESKTIAQVVSKDAKCLRAIYTVLKATNQEGDKGEALISIADSIASSLDRVKRVKIAFLESGVWKTAFSRSFGEYEDDDNRMIPRAIADAVREKREAVLFTAEELADKSKSVLASRAPIFACAPILTTVQPEGVLLVEGLSAEAFNASDLELVAAVADHAATVLDRIDSIEALRKAKKRLKDENVFLKEERERQLNTELIGESPVMIALKRSIERVAKSDASVLITGETGTGKELVARALHFKNLDRKNELFIAVNCGAIPENLLESELFGHKKGSFTGAISDRKGVFELAHGGTLFLDEISELPLNLQVKILRALQEKEFWPVGSEKPIFSDVRLIAASNRDLTEEVKQNRFREDLYYRIKVVELHTPALQEHVDDIPMLARNFLTRLSEKRADCPKDFTPAALAALSTYSFPGNVRELLNEIERASVFAAGEEFIDTIHLSPHISPETDFSDKESQVENEEGDYLREALLQYEKKLIENALKDHNGNRSQTAKFLGISRQALLTKMKKLGVT